MALVWKRNKRIWGRKPENFCWKMEGKKGLRLRMRSGDESMNSVFFYRKNATKGRGTDSVNKPVSSFLRTGQVSFDSVTFIMDDRWAYCAV